MIQLPIFSPGNNILFPDFGDCRNPSTSPAFKIDGCHLTKYKLLLKYKNKKLTAEIECKNIIERLTLRLMTSCWITVRGREVSGSSFYMFQVMRIPKELGELLYSSVVRHEFGVWTLWGVPLLCFLPHTLHNQRNACRHLHNCQND